MSHSFKPSRLRTWHQRHIHKRTQLYLLRNEAEGSTRHIFSTIIDAGSNTQHIFFTVNPSPLTFAVDEFLFGLVNMQFNAQNTT